MGQTQDSREIEVNQQLDFPSGLGVAIVTPLKEDQSIDFVGLEQVFDHVVHGGVDYVVALGTTGESVTLKEEEQQEVLKFIRDKNNGHIRLIAGNFGGNDTEALIKKIDRFDLQGFDALLSSSPAYNKPTQEGIYQHYTKLLDKSPLPIILYNVPGRTSSNINADTCLRLAAYSQLCIGVKDASGDMFQAAKIAKYAPEHFTLLSGDDVTALSLMANGGKGVISVIANAYPKPFKNMVDAALNNDFQLARKYHHELLDIHPHLYSEGNPTGIKLVLNQLDLCKEFVRLPLLKMSEKGAKKLRETLL